MAGVSWRSLAAQGDHPAKDGLVKPTNMYRFDNPVDRRPMLTVSMSWSATLWRSGESGQRV